MMIRPSSPSENQVENSVRYYGCSREGTPEQFANLIREHRSIENPLDHVLDVIFNEDASLANTGYAAEYMSLFRRITKNIVNACDRNEEWLTQDVELLLNQGIY